MSGTPASVHTGDKLSFGIAVVRDPGGEPVRYRLAAARELARLSLCLIPLGTAVDHLSALSVVRKRTWHDRATGTAVVRRRS